MQTKTKETGSANTPGAAVVDGDSQVLLLSNYLAPCYEGELDEAVTYHTRDIRLGVAGQRFGERNMEPSPVALPTTKRERKPPSPGKVRLKEIIKQHQGPWVAPQKINFQCLAGFRPFGYQNPQQPSLACVCLRVCVCACVCVCVCAVLILSDDPRKN